MREPSQGQLSVRRRCLLWRVGVRATLQEADDPAFPGDVEKLRCLEQHNGRSAGAASTARTTGATRSALRPHSPRPGVSDLRSDSPHSVKSFLADVPAPKKRRKVERTTRQESGTDGLQAPLAEGAREGYADDE